MDLQLKGKIALVTGSTQGIGFAIAEGLAREGATVVVNGRTQDRVLAAVGKIRAATGNGQVSGIAADVGTAAGVDHLVSQLPAVDILVNNTGIFEPKPFLEISDADWSRFFEVNVLSGVRLSRAYLPGLLEANWGRILFISSESGIQIPEEMIHYGTTKTAQIAVAGGLAQLTKGTGVTVNSVLPGPTRSQGVDDFVNSLAQANNTTPEAFEKQFFTTARPTSLLQRFATVDEVANFVVYLSSPLSSATNGAPLRVDGGVVRSAF